MARQNVNSRVSLYTIGFVCEGEKSEPFFLQKMYDSLRKGSYNIDIHPQNTQKEQQDNNGGNVTNARKEGTRQVSNRNVPDPLLQSYYGKPQPTNWILAGEELMDTCNEVWVLFDKDGHPDMTNAYNEIQRIRTNYPNFNVIFSSRCFEYYMLMHYEFTTKAYNKAECNHKEGKNTVPEHCMMEDASSNACDGSLCINGYARKNKYWKDSKNENVFETCDNLWWGILNAFHVKWYSVLTNSPQKIFERNPYLNIYHLTLRIMCIGCLEPFEPPTVWDKGANSYHSIERKGNILHFECKSVMPLSKIELQEYRLLTREEIEASKPKDSHIKDCLLQTHSITLNLQNGQSADIDITQFGLNAMDKYGIIEWDQIKYFVAPICQAITITPQEYEALKIDQLDAMVLKQMYNVRL